jgi:hypothetical protein
LVNDSFLSGVTEVTNVPENAAVVIQAPEMPHTDLVAEESSDTVKETCHGFLLDMTELTRALKNAATVIKAPEMSYTDLVAEESSDTVNETGHGFLLDMPESAKALENAATVIQPPEIAYDDLVRHKRAGSTDYASSDASSDTMAESVLTLYPQEVTKKMISVFVHTINPDPFVKTEIGIPADVRKSLCMLHSEFGEGYLDSSEFLLELTLEMIPDFYDRQTAGLAQSLYPERNLNLLLKFVEKSVLDNFYFNQVHEKNLVRALVMDDKRTLLSDKKNGKMGQELNDEDSDQLHDYLEACVTFLNNSFFLAVIFYRPADEF